jgi:hypothetical protein
LTHSPAPLQLTLLVSHVSGSFTFSGTKVHNPSEFGRLQALHVSVQSVLQHTPSMHLPTRHSVAELQVCPNSFLHSPLPSQATSAPVHVPSSWPEGTLEQMPTFPATLQAWHGVLQAVLQQTPSTQLSVTQSAEAAQLWPLIFLQTPKPSQALLAVEQRPSLFPAGTGEQVPLPERLHAWQSGHIAVAQQTPSTQLPLIHWPALVHAWPSGFLGKHAVISQ